MIFWLTDLYNLDNACQLYQSTIFFSTRKERKIIFSSSIKKKGARTYEKKGTIFLGKLYNFIAADFTTQSGKAKVSGTTVVTLVIVFPESSDKDEFYNHVGYYFVSYCRISGISCNSMKFFTRKNIALHARIFQIAIRYFFSGYWKSWRDMIRVWDSQYFLQK